MTSLPSNVVTLYGASDDLIEVDGEVEGCDEYAADDAHFVLIGEAGTVRLRVWYTRRGMWAIAAAPVDESSPMLPVTLTAAERGYTAQAVVEGVDMVVREHD